MGFMSRWWNPIGKDDGFAPMPYSERDARIIVRRVAIGMQSDTRGKGYGVSHVLKALAILEAARGGE